MKWLETIGMTIKCLFIFLSTNFNIYVKADFDPYSSLPRIRIEDGNLAFESALNKNLYFNSQKGIISINGENLGDLVAFVKQNNVHLKDLSYFHFGDVSNKVQDLTRNVEWLTAKFEQIQTKVNELSTKMRRLLGSGRNAFRPIDYRKGLRDLESIKSQLKDLTQVLRKKECESNPCRNGGTCFDAYDDYFCQCTEGWEGKNCDNDINECSRFIGTDLGCQNGATCRNEPGTYKCLCPPNYFGVHCTQTHDDCSSSTDEALCGHGKCFNVARVEVGKPKYICMCNEGWTNSKDNPACDTDIDECNSPIPHCSVNPLVECINTPGGFRCGPCPTGYTKSGHQCVDIDECQTNNGGCSLVPRVECINTIGSRKCGPCPVGYTGDGIVCHFVGVCKIQNGGCDPLATCVENMAISGVYRECRCPPHFIGNGEAPNGCVQKIGTNCSSNPCVYGSCIEPTSASDQQNFFCICFPGYTGALCDKDINECASNPCQNGGTCINQENSYICRCTEQYQGDQCQDLQESCIREIREPFGILTYPLSNNSFYAGKKNCFWTVTTEIGKVIKFNFLEFEVEYSLNCNIDFVEIIDGPFISSPSLGRYCGQMSDFKSNSSLVTSHHVASILFHSDATIHKRSFQISWNTTTPVCGGILPEADFGSFSSPGYPGNYPPLRDCYWLVQVPMNKRIQFNFASLNIEVHATCNFDYLKFYDGEYETDSILATFCNSTLPAPIISTGDKVRVHFHSDRNLQDLGFYITYSSVPSIPGCGDTLTSEKHSFSSPFIPEDYFSNLECSWLIRLRNSDDKIVLSFPRFDFKNQFNCSQVSVEVYDGSTSDSPLIGRYCNIAQKPPNQIISNSNKLLVKLQIHSGFKGFTFTAEYDTFCGGYFNSESGIIRTPNYPLSFPGNKRCEYHIEVPKGKIIEMTFEQTDFLTVDNCDSNFVVIRDGGSINSTEIWRKCGIQSNQTILSSFNELFIHFETNGSSHAISFFANYSSIDVSCGGILKENNGIITSPSHSDQYPASHQCNWLIQAPEGYIVQLTFTLFSLKDSTNCKIDYVLVQELNQTIGRYCGNQIPPQLHSLGNQFLVTFKSDKNLHNEEFVASYTFLNTQKFCGGLRYFDSGVIRTPNFPNNYPGKQNCIWKIIASEGRQIKLNFVHFDLESHNKCRYDYLEIRNGQDEFSPLIGTYCGRNKPPNITSHSNHLWLMFKSDGSLSFTGFEVFYDSSETGCGGFLTSPTGNIVSPNYPFSYSHNAECVWKIKTSKGSVISFIFNDLDLEGHFECQYDKVEIFDGIENSSPLLIKLCGGMQNPGTITSSKNMIRIRFVSDLSITGRGFKLNYWTNCSVVISSYRGVIESLNYPNPYPFYVNCSWQIVVPLGNNISLSFERFKIDTPLACTSDYLKIISESKNWTLCGNIKLPDQILVTNGIATIKYVAEVMSTDHFVGFRLEWRSVGCGGDFINKLAGAISSPNYPNPYPSALGCLWHIQAPPGYIIELLILDFIMEFSHDCQYDYLKIYGGIDKDSPLLATICNQLEKPRTFASTGNSMTLAFYSDNFERAKGFRAAFEAVVGECGGSLNLDWGTFMSPHYPNNYDFNDDCVWEISATGVHLISLVIEDLKIPFSQNCSKTFLAIYDGDNLNSPLLALLCGNRGRELTFKSTGNSITVRFKADGHSVDKGFKASYKVICGGKIIIEPSESGTLTSHNYPSMDLNMYECNWTLTAANPQDKIMLTFTHLESSIFNDCSDNYLEIREGTSSDLPPIGRYCKKIGLPIISKGNSLHISQHSFVIFRLLYTTSVSSCGAHFENTEGTFVSPGYPGNYLPNAECVWEIEAAAGNKITFAFSQFSLEENDFCNFDYVEIREENQFGPLIGRFCGNELPILNETSFFGLYIKFRSDSQSSSQGFIAHYSLERDIRLSGTQGVIESPGFPRLSLDLEGLAWTIVVPSLQVILVTFATFEVGWESDFECTQYLQFFDGLDDSAIEIGKFCGHSLPPSFSSRSNALKIQFTQSSMSRFRFTWQAVYENFTSQITLPLPNVDLSNCSKNILLLSGDERTLTSPGYPEGYQNLLNCTWLVEAEQGRHIYVKTEDMDLEGPNATCSYDKVIFYEYEGDQLWKKNQTFCSRFKTNIEFSTNLIKINFLSDFSVNKTGFKFKLFSKCGGIFTKEEGEISSQQIGSETIDCSWHIKVRSGRTIKIVFSRFNFGNEKNGFCSKSFLWLRNGAFSNSPSLGNGKYCGQNIPVVPNSASNQVYITFHGQVGIDVDFKLHFQEISLACGGTINLDETKNSAEITSPNYPQSPPHDIECSWLIKSLVHRSLRFEFELNRRVSSCNMNETFVEVFDGGTRLAPSLGKFCPRPVASTIVSSESVMLVEYVASLNLLHTEFRAMVNINVCGGTLVVDRELLFTSPNYPSNYGNNLDCRYILHSGDSDLILKLTFLEMNVINNSPENCSDGDFIEIKETSEKGQELGRFCGTSLNSSLPLRSSTDTLFFSFKTDGVISGRGFKIVIHTIRDRCNFRIHATGSGVITSPNYPYAHPSMRLCKWTITAPVDRRIKIEFLEYNLKPDRRQEGHCLDILNYDRFPISMSNEFFSNQLPCDNKIPSPIESMTSRFGLNFLTHGLSEREGFKAVYSINDETLCGGEVSLKNPKFESFGFNQSLTNQTMECLWTISTDLEDVNRTLSIHFDVFDIPPPDSNSHCWGNNFLTGYQEGSKFRSVSNECGNKTNYFYVFGYFKPNIFMVLLINSSRDHRGIKGNYKVDECGGTYRNVEKNFSSPLYPDRYPSGTTCLWLFSTDFGNLIKLTFLDFELPLNCDLTYIQIKTGFYDTWPVATQECGGVKPEPIISVSNHLSLLFKSDSVQTTKGFSFKIEILKSGCGGHLGNPTYTISTPNFPQTYQPNLECIWIINVDPGYRLNFTFIKKFDLETSVNCINDNLLIEKWSTNGWTETRKFCGKELPAHFQLDTHKARVTFQSNDNEALGEGFKLRYNQACGQTYTDFEGYITSPQYPKSYKDLITCEYLILGNLTSFVTITFEDFNLEASSTCSFDNVIIYKGNNTSITKFFGPFCGKEVPGTFFNMNSLLIRFHSDENIHGRGFRLKYYISNCGGNFTEFPGVIKSPNLGDKYIANADCVYTITAPKDRAIVLRFSKLIMQPCYKCICDYLEIRDGPNQNSTLIGTFCSLKKLKSIKSVSNNLWIKFVSNAIYELEGFEAQFDTTLGIRQNCGGTLLESPGIISSPDSNDDGMYEADLDCIWQIVSGDDQTVELTFEKLDIEEKKGPNNLTKCTSDYLLIKDGISQEDLTIDILCGSQFPQKMLSSTNKMFILFHSDSEVNKAGFKITYQFVNSTCGGLLILSNQTQSVTSPNFPNPYPPSIRCRWHFTIPAELKYLQFTLKFKSFDINCQDGDILDFTSEMQRNEPYRVCGNRTHSQLHARNGLYLTFSSGPSAKNNKGFAIDFDLFTCNQTYTADSGVIICPDHFNYQQQTCIIKIQAPKGYYISLYFLLFAMSRNCQIGKMEIRDGPNATSPLIARYCDYGIPPPLFSQTNNLYIRADHYYSRYEILYTTSKERGCGGNITAINGTFTSPLYPQSYARNAECIWYINSFGYHSLTLEILEFSFNSSAGCDINYIEIFDGSDDSDVNKIARYCGNDKPAKYQSRGNTLTLKMVTNIYNSGIGFKVKFFTNNLGLGSFDRIVYLDESDFKADILTV